MPYWSVYGCLCHGYIADAFLECLPQADFGSPEDKLLRACCIILAARSNSRSRLTARTNKCLWRSGPCSIGSHNPAVTSPW